MVFIVAPFTGAWIEITGELAIHPGSMVAPFTGAWIEIRSADNTQQFDVSRTLYGCVD